MTTGLLRPALEFAWALARLGEEASPVVPAPKPLRPFLRFARLPDRALDVARRVLDEDEEFRTRVADVIDEDKVGRAGILFLTRPEGWQADIAALRDAASDEQSAGMAEAEERTARRRLRGAEDAARRAEAALDELRTEAARLRDELAAERTARRSLEDALADARAAEAKALAEAGSSRAAAERARRERSDALAQLASTQAEPGLGPRVESPPPLPEETAEPTAEPAGIEAMPEALLDLAPEAEPEPPSADLDAVGRAIALAATAAEALGAALSDAAAALHPRELDAARSAPRPDAGSGAGDLFTESRRGAAGAVNRPTAKRRVAALLPPAVFDDSVEAAEHLVRLNGVVLLVDGYNVSKSRWPELPIGEQRLRLTNALGRLAARTGADVHAVFDGGAQPDAQAPTGPRRLVRVTFSPPDVEADDVILELVDGIALHRPVVVASSDRRVRLGAEARGANVVSSDQLLAVLDR